MLCHVPGFSMVSTLEKSMSKMVQKTCEGLQMSAVEAQEAIWRIAPRDWIGKRKAAIAKVASAGRPSMTSKSALPTSDPLREAETLVEVAKELHRLADEATERARAACARVNVPLPLFPDADREGL